MFGLIETTRVLKSACVHAYTKHIVWFNRLRLAMLYKKMCHFISKQNLSILERLKRMRKEKILLDFLKAGSQKERQCEEEMKK